MATINGYEVIQGTSRSVMEGDTVYTPPSDGVERTVTRTEHSTTFAYRSPCEADPNGKSLHEPGSKADKGKCQAGVLHDFALALQAVADVGTMGANKYSRGGWQSVPNGEERYFDAMWRHLLASKHEELDQDSGLPHFAHFCWNALAILELRKRA